MLSGANVHDMRMLGPTLDAVPPVKNGLVGHPRRRPERVHADKGYDYRACREAVRRRGGAARIARRGVEPSGRLGRWRWVVERTFAWLNQYRRLRVRYERRADVHLALVLLGCALICLKQLRRTF